MVDLPDPVAVARGFFQSVVLPMRQQIRSTGGGILRASLWIEDSTSVPGWTMAYQIFEQAGRPVIGEVRIFPSEPGRQEHGVWSGAAALVPTGGLTLRLLKRVPLAAQARHVDAVFAELRKLVGASPAPRRPAPASGVRRGRKGRPDVFYAQLADDYLKALNRSRAPVADLAQRRGVRATQVRDWLHLARRRGLLSAPTRGETVASGVLTERALALLSRDQGKEAAAKRAGRRRQTRTPRRTPRRST